MGYLNNDTEVQFVVNDGPTEASRCVTYTISGTLSPKQQAQSDPEENGNHFSCVKNEGDAAALNALETSASHANGDSAALTALRTLACHGNPNAVVAL